MKQILFATFTLIVVASCQNAAVSNTPIHKDSIANAIAIFKKTTISMVDYKKDPACGMPLTAGLEDTTRYKGKLYGFCSKECKAEFLKDPGSYVTSLPPHR
jgi:YHS domain-containing protein